MAAEKDYASINWNKIYQIDESSPTGMSYKIFTYAGDKNQILHGYPGKPAGHKAQCKNGDKRVWAIYYKKDGKYKEYMVHRILMVLSGNNPNGLIVDHINGDSLDNNISNLRLVERHVNARNAEIRKDSPYGINGVNQTGSSFVARWKENGKSRSKSFSFLKYGIMPAFKMAVEARNSAILNINRILGQDGYTERHLTQKEKV